MTQDLLKSWVLSLGLRRLVDGPRSFQHVQVFIAPAVVLHPDVELHKNVKKWGLVLPHRLHSSSFLGFLFRILIR